MYLEQGPAEHGWVEDQAWNAARVATLVGRRFHVSYSISGATRLMHRLGFGPQVPARKVAECDEQAVTAWKEATWAEAKERGRPAEATSASRTRQASPAGRPKDAPGPTGPHPCRDGQRPSLGTSVGGRADRHAARPPYPAVPPSAIPSRGQRQAPQHGERDFIALFDGVHQLVKAPIVLVRDRLNTHVSHAMRDLSAEHAWLTAFRLPACSPDLNPVEWVWAHVKRSLANLAVVALVHNRLKRLRYRPEALDGFTAGTGLALDTSTSPCQTEVSMARGPDCTRVFAGGRRTERSTGCCGPPGRRRTRRATSTGRRPSTPLVRAHQDAARARKRDSANRPHRSRDGLNSKVHLPCDDRGRPLAFVVMDGDTDYWARSTTAMEAS